MSKYNEIFEFMPVDTQVKVCKALLEKLLERGKRPIQSNSYEMGLDFQRGKAAISNLKSWDDVDDMLPLLPHLEELVSILNERKEKSA